MTTIVIGGASSSTLVAIERISGTADIAALDFDSGLGSTYRTYLLTGWMQPASDDVEFWIRMSDDGGSTYEADAGDYSYRGNLQDEGGTNRGGNSGGDTKIKFNNADANMSVGNASDEFIQFDLWIHTPDNAARSKIISGNIAYMSANNTLVGGNGTGRIEAIANVEGIRLMFESGDVTAYDVTLYGLANS